MPASELTTARLLTNCRHRGHLLTLPDSSDKFTALTNVHLTFFPISHHLRPVKITHSLDLFGVFLPIFWPAALALFSQNNCPGKTEATLPLFSQL
jgi:hypothetical protein